MSVPRQNQNIWDLNQIIIIINAITSQIWDDILDENRHMAFLVRGNVVVVVVVNNPYNMWSLMHWFCLCAVGDRRLSDTQ
jgi:hypothetical protein